MTMDDKDELIEMQKQVIGILFEVIKRLQANSDLDEEYFEIITNQGDKKRIDNILKERNSNAEIITRLLAQLDT